MDVGHVVPTLACTVVDISNTGAWLAVGASESISAEFKIVLSSSGLLSRRCKLVWRTEDQAGVEFDADWPRRDRNWNGS